jgi:predicted SAM-dependent methyltransferase
MRLIRGETVRLRIFSRPFTIREYMKNHDVVKVNIGAGPHTKEGWLTADAFKVEADIYMNANARWPFDDNSVDVLYSEHMLEHIKVDRVPKLLAEAYRVLKPGGLFRVTVPDLEIHAKNYIAKNDEFFKPIIDKYQARLDKQKDKYWLIRSNGGAFMSRAVQRFYRHRWMYDFDTLSSCLYEVGFDECIKQTCGVSINKEAGEMDREDRAFETLYVDAIKK